MGFLDRFRKKKAEETVEATRREKGKVEEMSALERICKGDEEIYRALRGTMFLDPRNIGVSMKEAEKNAKDFEKKGDKPKARTWYGTAGGLAIYEGDVKKVKEYFGKCAELSSDNDYPILKIPERAVNKAQEYYQKHLKG
jgi:hypothetical protein